MKRIVLALVLLMLPVHPARAADPNGQFVLRCLYSHTLPDDPIVSPGHHGASHLHDFYGNTGVDASSTFESMLEGETTCRVPSDTAGYWTPTAFLNGVQITPTVMRIYYIGPASGDVETIPAGLQMVGGNRDATSPAENPNVSWSCGSTTERNTPKADAPYDCTPWSSLPFVDGVVVTIDFPSCWNGVGLRPEDVAYPEGSVCPAAFPHRIPRLSERVHLGVMNPLNPDGTQALTLSSGPPHTLHADFWNTWQQERLDQLVLDCLAARVRCGSVDATSTIEWSRQFGTTRYDLAYASAPDGDGGAYVVGFTNFALEGQTYHHRYDAFIRRFDATGTELWTQQFGTNGTDRALAVAVAGDGVYVAGSTDGRFPKQIHEGGLDAFVARFDGDGTREWLTQFGTHRDDEAAAVDATATAVFAAGTTRGRLSAQPKQGPSDAFVVRFEPDGRATWEHTAGGAGDDGALAIDARGDLVVYGGSTQGFYGEPGSLDGFIAALELDGAHLWVWDLPGPENDAVTSLVSRSGGVYFAGWTAGSVREEPAAGGIDAFVGKLREDRTVGWIRQFGSEADDDAAAIVVVGRGVYVAGSTTGSFPDGGLIGETDGFIRKYLPKNGTEIWTRQFGTIDYDRVYGMSSDSKGVVAVGTTHGAFEGLVNAGDRDVFAVRIAFT